MAGFFETREQLIAQQRAGAAAGVSSAAAQSAGAASGARKVMTVGELTRAIDKAIKAGVPAQVHVRGELSNVKRHAGSGHIYFTLKEAQACIDCVMFNDVARRLRFDPRDGLELIATGRIGIYEQRGRYQLYATALEPIGQGALELAYRQTMDKLAAEGLFNPERKRAIPRYPRRIVLVTSRQTAAVQDMLKVLRRYPFLRVSVFHVPVQGDGSAEKIVEALDCLSRAQQVGRAKFDVVLLGRGGGSFEDLWEFNEEIVSRAMVRCVIPVVTGIGHEVDVSIADLAADHHAHTPTEAARFITAEWATAGDAVDDLRTHLTREMRRAIERRRERLRLLERSDLLRRPRDRINRFRQQIDDAERMIGHGLRERLIELRERLAAHATVLERCHPRHRIAQKRQELIDAHRRLARATSVAIERRRAKVKSVAIHLRAVSPERILGRGYSITTHRKSGAIVRSRADVKPGDTLVTRLADGVVESVVQDERQGRLFE